MEVWAKVVRSSYQTKQPLERFGTRKPHLDMVTRRVTLYLYTAMMRALSPSSNV